MSATQAPELNLAVQPELVPPTPPHLRERVPQQLRDPELPPPAQPRSDATTHSLVREDLEAVNAGLERRVRQRTFELQVISELSQEIGCTFTWHELVGLTLHHLYRIVPYDVAAICLAVEESGEIYLRPVRRLHPELAEELRCELEQSFQRYSGVGLEAESRHVHDLSDTEPTGPEAPLSQLCTRLEVPLIVGPDNEVAGLLALGSKRGEAYSQEQVQLAHTVASQVGVSIDRLRAVRAAEQQRLEGLVEGLPVGVVLLSDRQRLVNANLCAREYLEALAGGAATGETLTHLGERPVEDILEDCCAPWPCEILVGDSGQRVFEVVVQAMETSDQRNCHVLVIRDVTKEREIQDKLRQQDRLAAVGQLAAGIAHDFNNLLTGVVGFAELLELRSDMPDSAKDPLRVIRNQGRRAADLISQILDFSRQSIIQKHPLDLVPVLKETHKLLTRTIPETINIGLEVADGDYLVNADITQLQQMVTNLVVNARDAMPDGGELRLSLFRSDASHLPPDPSSESASADWITLEVQDTGTGMAEDVVDHVFEPFFSTKGPKGTGLGLAQVYGIVMQHDGHVEVESTVGGGTTFTVYLPAAVAQSPRAEGEETGPAPRGNGETVLVVEDEEHVLRATESMLEALDYRVLTATNGLEGLEEYESNCESIDLVVTDMVMPEMGGAELVEALRERDPDAKIIACTGYPLGEDGPELLEEGVVNFLQKPITLRQLGQAVAEALQ